MREVEEYAYQAILIYPRIGSIMAYKLAKRIATELHAEGPIPPGYPSDEEDSDDERARRNESRSGGSAGPSQNYHYGGSEDEDEGDDDDWLLDEEQKRARASEEIHKQQLLVDKQPHHVGAQSEELHDACWREDVEAIRTLVGEDPSMLNECDSGGQNVLHLCAFWGSLRVCETLLALGIDIDAVNLHRQRPLDIALQWGHLDVADAIRHRGGTSLFETKVMHLEAHNLQLEDELTRARADLLAEREKRETMQHERDVARRVARMSHREWKQELVSKMLSRGSEKLLETKLYQCDKERQRLRQRLNEHLVWGSMESNWRKQLQQLLLDEKQRVQEKVECCCMAGEETRAAVVERNIATEIRDHALAEAKAATEARVVAESVCKEAIKYMEKLRPFKTKYTQLLRRTGLHSMSKSLSELLEACPKEVLQGAVAVLSDLARHASTAQPGAQVPRLQDASSVSGGGGGEPMAATEASTATDSANTNQSMADRLQLELKKKAKVDQAKSDAALMHAGTLPSPSSGDGGSGGVGKLFGRMKSQGVLQRTNAQRASDARRSRGESNRMGGLPGTPFDLLVLDPFGKGLEVLSCVHVKKDTKGYDRLRVVARAPVDPTSDHFKREDERRLLDHQAKVAVQRAQAQHRRTQKKIRALNRTAKPQGGGKKYGRPATVDGTMMGGGVGGSEMNASRAKKLYEVEKLWAAAFSSPKEQRAKAQAQARARARAAAAGDSGEGRASRRRRGREGEKDGRAVHSSSSAADILGGGAPRLAPSGSLPSIHHANAR